MMRRLCFGSAQQLARRALLPSIALVLITMGCGDGDVMGDAGLDAQGGPSITARCGDGTLGAGEQCDDGNTNSGDGCSSSCAREGATAGPNDAGGSASTSDGGTSGNIDAAASGGDASAGGNGDAGALDAGDATVANGSEAGSPEGGGGNEDASGPVAREPLCPEQPPGPCEECNCTMCRTELDACTNLPGNATEGPAQGMPKAALCEALVRCGRSTGCRALGCLCTMENQATCLTGETPPDGPCKDEVLGAAETTDMMTFLTRATMPAMGYAVAVASAVSTCAGNMCAASCPAP
jgi:cysteine-rich repeat protein